MKERNYGIDLLRLVCMYLVCVVHVLGQGGVLNGAARGTLNHAVYWLMETIGYCAVDTFALISGYMAKNSGQKYDRIVNMWFQAFFYSFILTLILCVCGVKGIGLKELAMQAFPVTFQAFWYFTAYFGLFFAMPVLNRALFAVSPGKARKMLIVIVLLFSVLSTINDPFETALGGSMLWLVLLYVFGVLAKRVQLFGSRKTSVLLLWLGGCVLLGWAVVMLTGLGRSITNVSPTTLCSAMILVIVFSRMKLSPRCIGVVRRTSGLAFGIYLYHMNYAVWNHLLPGRFSSLAGRHIVPGVLLVLLAAAGIFLIGLGIEALRAWLHRKLRIPQLSCLIVDKSRSVVEKAAALLQ